MSVAYFIFFEGGQFRWRCAPRSEIRAVTQFANSLHIRLGPEQMMIEIPFDPDVGTNIGQSPQLGAQLVGGGWGGDDLPSQGGFFDQMQIMKPFVTWLVDGIDVDITFTWNETTEMWDSKEGRSH